MHDNNNLIIIDIMPITIDIVRPIIKMNFIINMNININININI